jgi:hypothetical protein
LFSAERTTQATTEDNKEEEEDEGNGDANEPDSGLHTAPSTSNHCKSNLMLRFKSNQKRRHKRA